MLQDLKRYVALGIFSAAAVALFVLGRDCGSHVQDAQVQKLAQQLAENETTLQTQSGLYQTKIAELDSLTGLLGSANAQEKALQAQLKQSQADLLTTQQVVLQWKTAYQGALKATQTFPTPPQNFVITPDMLLHPPPWYRLRVDFSGKLGPILATGYTETNPPESHLSLTQTDPLTLTLNVARNKDGTWSSTVASSDKNIDVRVKLAGVDPGIITPSWKQRIWLDAGATFLGDISGQVGLSYHFDSWSVGPQCFVGKTVAGCGLSLGIRLFR